MKTFKIKDENGKEFEVNELEEVKTEEEVPTKDEDTSTLTDLEIEALRKIIPHVDKLIALLDIEEEEHDVDEDLEEDIEDSDDEDKEEIVDTDEDCEKMHDSVGAIENKTKANDSIEIQDEISNAWSKRYGGRE